ncbi:hypothetical protein [Aquabacterium sp. OR-4]|uniref:hypothetical protein n=1 Tax=Aquabacterium sp. OR-4 TaxID=2978127 RepID=UPI0021B217D4|nr:hypothetical protein [Aquabacterium sp. OR-4]MDT7834286.1 hypothetical protein [Aquabacterium sp. OR-4]
MSEPVDLARVRHDNALRLFDEFVHAHVRSADAATLRGLERRFAERLQIQPSYWSQIKARSRQIGERLARQFEQLCRKPPGWMDQPHGEPAAATSDRRSSATVGSTVSPSLPLAIPMPGAGLAEPLPDNAPIDDDERFIVGLVLTYYRRHPQRARVRLLDLLGEVLSPAAAPPPAPAAALSGKPRPVPGAGSSSAAAKAPAGSKPAPADDDLALWQRSQAGVAPLPRKR